MGGIGAGEFFEFTFWPDSGAGFSGLVEGLDEVPGEENNEQGETDCKADDDFLPGEGFPVGLEVIDESGDGDTETAEHHEKEKGFPEDAIDDFLPRMGGDESRGVAVHEPRDGGYPERGKDTDDMNQSGGVALGLGGFGAVGLEGHVSS